MIMPWAHLAWDLNKDIRALETMKTAAEALMTRYSPIVGCIRSWDKCQTKKYDFKDPNTDFLMIIASITTLLFFVTSILMSD